MNAYPYKYSAYAYILSLYLMKVLHTVISYHGFNISLSLQWDLSVNTFENKDSCIMIPIGALIYHINWPENQLGHNDTWNTSVRSYNVHNTQTPLCTDLYNLTLNPYFTEKRTVIEICTCSLIYTYIYTL